MVDPVSGSIFVIVAGGFASNDPSVGPLDSTEVWTLTNGLSQPWQIGPSTLSPISYAAFASIGSGSKLLLIGGNGPGGYLRTLSTFTCSDSVGCYQQLLVQKMTRARSGFVATPVTTLTKGDCRKVKGGNMDKHDLQNSTESAGISAVTEETFAKRMKVFA